MAKRNSNIDIAFNEFDTMVTKFFEQTEISFKDVAKPQPVKEKKKTRRIVTPIDQQQTFNQMGG